MGKKNHPVRIDNLSEDTGDLLKEQLFGKAPPQKKQVEDKKESNSVKKEVVTLQSLLNLPEDARELLEYSDKQTGVLKLKQHVIGKIENLNLLHHRYSKWTDTQQEKLTSLLAEKTKMTSDLNQRTVKIVEDAEDYITVCYKVLDKLMIGTGGESPYGSRSLMTFHHLYGDPYLPATAIKGMLRSYWIQEGLPDLEKLFGVGESEGFEIKAEEKLLFFDIFPEKYNLVFEVMTPHHKKYYGDGKNPTDDEDPAPITFPALEDANFKVYVACGKSGVLEKYKIKKHLEQAFKYYGIGAKTALGYGLGE